MKISNRFFLISMFVLMFMSGVIAQSDVSYVLTLNYNGNTFAVDSITLVEGKSIKDVFEPSEGFTIKVLDKNNEILYSEVFIADLTPIREAPDYFFDDSGEQVTFEDTESPQEIKETSIVLTIPYFEEAEKIQIYDSNDQLVLEFSIDEEFNKTGFDFNNLKTIGILIIIVLLIGLITFFIIKKVKKAGGRKDKKDSKKKEHHKKDSTHHKTRIEELEKTIKELKKDISSSTNKK